MAVRNMEHIYFHKVKAFTLATHCKEKVEKSGWFIFIDINFYYCTVQFYNAMNARLEHTAHKAIIARSTSFKF